MLLGERARIRAEELPALMRADSGDGRFISQFVKTWADVGDDEKAALIAAPVSSGSERERAITAAVVHGMCRHYEYTPPKWVHQHRSPVPIHPITDRRLTSSGMRARIIMTASPVCREHNVWFSESLVSARRDIRPPKPPPHFKTRKYALKVAPNERRMSKDEILMLFEGLDAELARLGVRTPARMVVGGGAAMCFLADARATYDVDALSELDSEVQQAIRRVGGDYGLSPNWLDTSASAFADLADPGFSARIVYSGHSLLVLAPDLEHLLAMKLLSARDKDLSDAAWLARELGLRDQGALRGVVAGVYDSLPHLRESVEWSGGYIEHVLDEIDLQEQLEAAQQADRRRSGDKRRLVFGRKRKKRSASDSTR